MEAGNRTGCALDSIEPRARWQGSDGAESSMSRTGCALRVTAVSELGDQGEDIINAIFLAAQPPSGVFLAFDLGRPRAVAGGSESECPWRPIVGSVPMAFPQLAHVAFDPPHRRRSYGAPCRGRRAGSGRGCRSPSCHDDWLAQRESAIGTRRSRASRRSAAGRLPDRTPPLRVASRP